MKVGEQSFTEFINDHPDPDEREHYLQGLEFDLRLADGNPYPHKGKFYAEDRNLDTKTGSIRMEFTFRIRETVYDRASLARCAR